MQWEELGAALDFDPDGCWAWSDEISIKGSRTSVSPALFCPKKVSLHLVLPARRNWRWCPFSPRDHLHSWPSSFMTF